MTTAKLLHISASPRGAKSESLALASEFIDELAQHRPEVTVEHWDLWDGSLPAFGADAAAGKISIFDGQRPENEQVWRQVTDTFDRFAAADHYLFSVPMWNHGIPYVLKHLVDVVSQPGLVFGFDPQTGYTGLVRGRTATVVYTSAVYGPGLADGFGHDFQQTYFDDWLRWAGFEDVVSVALRRTLTGPDVETERRAAQDAVRRAAKRL